MTSPHDPSGAPDGQEPTAPTDPTDPTELTELADPTRVFPAVVTPLPPPPGAFAAVRRRAAARRRRRVVAAGAATAVCLAGASVVVAVTRPEGPPPVGAPSMSRTSASAGEERTRGTEPAEDGTPSTTAQPSPGESAPGAVPSEPGVQDPSEGGAGQEGTAVEDASCAADRLGLEIASTEGAAGSLYLTLRFTNTGPAACTLTGYPGVSLVAGDDGEQIGAPAEHESGTATAVRLAPGGSAVTDLRVTQAANYPAEDCDPTPARGLRVYPPDERTALFLADDALTGCADEDVTLLSVTPVREE